MKATSKKIKKRNKQSTKPLKSIVPKAYKSDAEKRKDFEKLAIQLTEFMGSYAVIGYDFEGNTVSMVNYHNTQEYNSLTVLVHDYLIYLQNQNQTPPQDG